MVILLETYNLTKRYKKQNAVDNVNITINKGDIYGCIGQNGAGKSTFIRLITNVINPTGGSYKYNFTEEKYGNVSAIVETPSLFNSLTARENIKSQMILLGNKDYSKINELIEIVGLTKLLVDKNKKVGHFSLGMKQRLSIAIALTSNPEFVILDEPMNGLDPEGIVSFREMILNLNKNYGITFFISSHILSELSKIATRYGIIHKGKLMKEFSPEDLNNSGQKRTIIEVNSIENIETVLLKANILKYEIENKTITVFGEISASNIFNVFAAENIEIKNINTEKEDIEHYFLNLIGENK